MNKWTKEQLSAAMEQIENTDALESFLDYSEAEVVDVILELICQRNELLTALKDIRLNNAGSHERNRGWNNALVAIEKAEGA